MSICKGCQGQLQSSYELEHGLCWPCNDKEITEKYHKAAKFVKDNETLPVRCDTTHVHEKRYQAETLSNPSEGCNGFWLSKTNEEVTELDKKVRPSKYQPKMTLPTDSTERKNYPLFRGLLRYFPAALAGVSNTSQRGNDKHNPGQELHHARGKSTDHGDCILRHLMDLTDLLAARDRGVEVSDEQILEEVNSLTWRSLALSQELHESLGKAPLAPGAKE